jgi:flagellar hook-associated protein 3 FlgL
MRITDHGIVDLAAASTARNESRVAELAQEVSSGLKIAKPSDDPAAWLTAQRARIRAALNDGTGVALETGHQHMVATDGALASLSGIVQQSQQLAIEGANGTQTADSRAAIGAELDGLFASAVAAANAQDSNGEYLLAGTNSLAQPFDSTTGAYAGNAAARSIASETASTQVATIAGAGLTASNGVDILPLLKTLATALNANDLPTIQTSLTGLDTAVKQLAQLRGQTGGRMAVLESAKAAHDTLSTRIATTISNAVEVDTVAAASELAKASQALTVAQSVTSHVLQILAPTK